MSDIDREAHDPLEQNMDENAQMDEVTEAIVGEGEVTSAEESAMNTDNDTAMEATAVLEVNDPVIDEVGEAADAALKKHKNRESTSEKAKKAAAVREATGKTLQSHKKQLDPLRLRSKSYRAMVKLVDKTKVYTPEEAFDLVKKTSIGKFDAAVEVHIKVKAENVRNTVVLPHGTGKTKKVAVADDATIEAISAGKLDFDVLLATPAQMPKLAKYAKLLGPKGLMPSPKAGTVTDDIEKVRKEISGGRVEYRADKNGVVHMAIGRISFSTEKLVENYKTLEQALGTAAKVQSVSAASTMGPGVKVSFGA